MILKITPRMKRSVEEEEMVMMKKKRMMRKEMMMKMTTAVVTMGEMEMMMKNNIGQLHWLWQKSNPLLNLAL